MGRGERVAASRSASGLLFGPRTPRITIRTKNGASDQELIEATNHLAGGDPSPAIDLMLKFNDQALNESPLAESLADQLKNLIEANQLSDRDWRKLIEGLTAEIAKDGSVKAFDSFDSALGLALNNKLENNGPSLAVLEPFERQFIFATDHPLPDKITFNWAKHFPNQAIDFGVDGYDQHSGYCSEEKMLIARQGFYLAANRHPFKIDQDVSNSAGSPLFEKVVGDDLQNGRADDLIYAITRDLRNCGGQQLFSSTSSSVINENRYGSDIGDGPKLISHLMQHSPIQAQNDYQTELNNYFQESIDRTQGVSEGLAKIFNLSPQGKTQLVEAYQDWVNQGPAKLSRAVTNGHRSETIAQEIIKISEIIAQESSSEHLADSILVSKQNADWQNFREQYLARPLLPDRKLKLDRPSWQMIIAGSLETNGANPLDLSINTDKMMEKLLSLSDFEIKGNSFTNPWR